MEKEWKWWEEGKGRVERGRWEKGGGRKGGNRSKKERIEEKENGERKGWMLEKSKKGKKKGKTWIMEWKEKER